MLTIFSVIIVLIAIWVPFEIWRSPMYDDDFNLIKPYRTLKEIFKKKK